MPPRLRAGVPSGSPVTSPVTSRAASARACKGAQPVSHHAARGEGAACGNTSGRGPVFRSPTRERRRHALNGHPGRGQLVQNNEALAVPGTERDEFPVGSRRETLGGRVNLDGGGRM
jgi:hypothetical protein